MSASPAPTADVSVRLAMARDVAAVAGVQARAWRQDYAGLLPPAVLDLIEQSAQEQWAGALHAPPTDAHHLLVALAGQQVVGLVSVSPCEPADGEPRTTGALGVLAVDPAARRQGHGSRLLAAAVETMRANRLTAAVCWLAAADGPQQSFLLDAGWGLDGAGRELDAGTVLIPQVRLHTDIS